MSKTNSNAQSTQQRLKLAVIPLLVLVLIAVLAWPSSKGDSAAEVITLAPELVNPVATPTARSARSKWPSIALDEVIAFNPFEPRAVATKSEPASEVAEEVPVDLIAATTENATGQATVLTAATGKLQAIYFDAKGAAAIVDSKVMRVGDMLPGGERIVEITSHGIKLDRY